MVMWQLGRDDGALRAHLARGGVLAYPSEAVYGLGGLATEPAVLAAINALKGRPATKPMLTVAGCWDQISPWLPAEIPPPPARDRPTSYLYPAGPQAPAHLVFRGKIGLRLTDFAPLQRLCALAGPLLSTSANGAGQEPARDLAQLAAYFPELPLLAGALGDATRPSQIIDWASGAVVRA